MAFPDNADDGAEEEPVEDFAAAGPAPPEDPMSRSASTEDSAETLEGHSQPRQQ